MKRFVIGDQFQKGKGIAKGVEVGLLKIDFNDVFGLDSRCEQMILEKAEQEKAFPASAYPRDYLHQMEAFRLNKAVECRVAVDNHHRHLPFNKVSVLLFLALKPYYELTEWFMIRGTLGVGLDYRNFDVRVSGCGKSSCDDWDCYMVYGLGGLFHWNGASLGFDFLGKAFDDDLDVNSRYVSGSIDNAKWEFRVYVGYEF